MICRRCQIREERHARQLPLLTIIFLWFSDFRILNITERSVELMRLNFTFYEKFGKKD